MSTKKFCDECGNEIRFGCDPMSAYRRFGVSPRVNSQSTKYAVWVAVRHHDTSNQPDLCGSCLDKIIGEINRLHGQVSEKLEEIAALFTRPGETKITIIIRTPWLSDGGVVLSNDSDEEAIAEFRRLQNSPTTTVIPARAGQP